MPLDQWHAFFLTTAIVNALRKTIASGWDLWPGSATVLQHGGAEPASNAGRKVRRAAGFVTRY